MRARPRRRALRVLLAAAGCAAVLVGVQAGGTALPADLPLPTAGSDVPTGTGGIAHLQPELRRAVERAIAAAGDDGVPLQITSGWRSADRQQQLYDEAVARYGSPQRARQWVLPPDESEHVRGGAVDVGPVDGASWLEEHGAGFGLCRRYDNEPWHFERLAGDPGSACPSREPHA